LQRASRAETNAQPTDIRNLLLHWLSEIKQVKQVKKARVSGFGLPTFKGRISPLI
jgi:hypothetical protein